jgi:hypothetical protein
MMSDHRPLHSQDEHTAASLVCHLGASAAITVGAVAGGVLMVGTSFSLPSIHPDYPGVISWANFAGVVLLIFGVPLGLVSTHSFVAMLRKTCLVFDRLAIFFAACPLASLARR